MKERTGEETKHEELRFHPHSALQPAICEGGLKFHPAVLSINSFILSHFPLPCWWEVLQAILSWNGICVVKKPLLNTVPDPLHSLILNHSQNILQWSATSKWGSPASVFTDVGVKDPGLTQWEWGGHCEPGGLGRTAGSLGTQRTWVWVLTTSFNTVTPARYIVSW